MHVYTKTALVMSLILFIGLIYASASALSIYLLRFTITNHESLIVRNFNAVLYDHEDDHEVTMYLNPDNLGAIESGCGTRTLSFPNSYTCKSQNKTIELHSSSAFVVTFTDVDSGTDASIKEFMFSAEDLCNKDISRDGLCLDISGKGTTNGRTITGDGIFRTHTIKTVYNINGQTLSRGLWSAIEMVSTSDTEISFKTYTSTGIVYIRIVEGESENEGCVCAYGPQVGIQNAEDTVCVDNALVIIKASKSS